jgi:hypothetical protein
MAKMLVTVASFREPWEAHLLRGRLQAEGILAFVAFDQHAGNKWIISNALGGAKVQVSSDEIELAREVEAECRNGVFKKHLESQIGELDDPVCPHCGGTEFRKRRPFLRAALAVILSLGTGTILPPIGWILDCKTCGKAHPAPHRPISREKCLLVAVLMALVGAGVIALTIWFYTAFQHSPQYGSY